MDQSSEDRKLGIHKTFSLKDYHMEVYPPCTLVKEVSYAIALYICRKSVEAI